MTILMIGNFQVPYTTENHWALSYEKLGHKVLKFQENEARTQHIYQQGKNADLIHYVHTHKWNTPGNFAIGELLKKFESRSIPTISVHLDYWRGLKREIDVNHHPFWKTQYVFTADGGSNQWYRDKGINHFYLPAGVLEEECYIGDWKEKFAYDVIFVGSRNYHPEWEHRPKLIDWLESTYGDKFKRFAGDVEPHRTVRGRTLNDIYASAKVVIGDSLCLDYKHRDYFSDRLFETTGRGGFIIFPEIKGIRDFFTEDELVTYKFGKFSMLQDLIDYYLERNEEREKIQLAGHLRTKHHHTYTHRVKQIFEILRKDGVL